MDEAREMLAELLAGGPEPTGSWDAWFLVEVYAALGEKDEAFRWLEAALEGRHSLMPWLHVSPHFEPLRSDPEFQELLSARPGAS